MDDQIIPKRVNVLQVKPDGELCFKGNFNDIVTTQMKLINPTNEKVCFKVKTTAPRRYCVRPNNGILAPRSSVDVLLRLQPLDKPDSDNTKHKFMVQSLVPPSPEIPSMEKLWRSVTSDKLMYSKLKCVFEKPDGTRLTADEINTMTASGAAQSQKPFDFDAKDGSVPEETLRMRQDVEKLRLENKKLKESEKQLRKLTSTSKMDTQGDTPSPTQREIIYPSIVYIIVALILGIIFGKFIL